MRHVFIIALLSTKALQAAVFINALSLNKNAAPIFLKGMVERPGVLMVDEENGKRHPSLKCAVKLELA